MESIYIIKKFMNVVVGVMVINILKDQVILTKLKKNEDYLKGESFNNDLLNFVNKGYEYN